MEQEKKKNYLLSLSEEDHCRIKSLAAAKGISIRKLILLCIAMEIKKYESERE